ncbi:fatty acid synthase-like isoform X2 [Choristoneura fumiferana]|uniref:fatty acid synthase-like isoform X2 n=1 Tax=Choristoneura fumiferana TaxID=7141 RepID=UPI003D153B76
MLPENWDTGADDIVLSGLSGRLPESNNIEEFAKNLFDGVDLVTADDRRWPPGSSLHVHRLDMLSPVGRCAAFDADGRGYVRSEAAVTVLLQRRRDCRRLYCTVRGVRTNSDGYKVQGITYPTGAMQRQLAQETFEEARLRPQDVAYVEAHGTGTKVGDPEEVNAIDELFCESRATPLLIGSVKSNMGHAEAASGLCSIAKVVVAMEHGVIPGNLHYRTPNPDIPALSDGRIKVVDRNTPWQGGLVAVNSFGFGGANAHVILESQGGERPPPASYPAPRLVLASGRTEAAVERLLRLAVDHPRDAELHALLDAVHARAIPRHIYRGYSVLNPEHDEPSVLETMKMELTETRPVWFVFTGMGSQWHGMARALMRLPVFAASIARLAVALRPLGFDLPYVLTEAPEANFDAVVNSMVSITAVQVALVDVLREVGVRPNGIVGFSVGENGCAYADGSLTAEQAVLCTYWRARCIVDAALPPGAMAAVGLTWEETARRCPPDVFPACHNSADNVTVSGPSDSVEQLVAELKTEGVFVRSVNSTGIAFHSKYIAAAVPQLRTKLQEIIPEPRPRSLHWISTSLGPDQQDSEWGKLCGAEYHVNNVVSPVRFADALRAIPEDAIVVEVAPHALLNAVLRRALPSATHVPLVRRDHPEPLSHLLQALGRLFTAGAQPRVSSLYPPVSWPVSRGTPMLASAIEWDHSKEWTVANYKLTTHTGENVIEFDLGKPDQAFLDGHNIDGRVLFPGAGYLTMVWRTVAKVNNLNMNEIAVLLEDIHFRRATIMSRDVPLRFLVTLLSNSGNFEICEGGAVVATGRARLVTDPAAERLPVAALADDAPVEDIPSLDAHDVYKELHLRGYNYQGVFCGVLQSNANVTEGLLAWENNWISFIDSMLQFQIIAENTRVLKLPTRIQRVLIDPAAQKAAEAAATSGGNLPIRRYKDLSVTVAGGVELRGIKNSLAPRRTNALIAPKLEKYEFTPLDTTRVDTVDVSLLKGSALTVALQLVLENSNTLRLKVAEVALGRPASELLLPLVLPILDAEPQVRVDASLAAGANAVNYAATVEPLGVKLSNKEWLDDMDFKCQLVLATNVLEQHDASVLRKLTAMLDAHGHLLLEAPANALDKPGAAALLEDAHLVTVARQGAAACEYVLLRRVATRPATRIILEVRDDDFAWVETLGDAMKRATSEELRVYVWSRDAGSGVLGLGTCLRREAGGDKLRVYYLPGAKDDFDPDAPALYAQVQLDLTFNVLRAGIWGTYRHFLLDDPANMQLQVEHAHADILTRGDLSSLRWIQSDLQYATSAPQAAHSNLCHVYYAPLNFRDIMVATGKLSPDSLPGNLAGQECILGLEFSGRLSSGKRVMGMVAAKGLATTVVADEGFMWDVPAAWSLKEAATVPVAYATAYYALAVRGSMKRGDSVLVHAGAGGVGQAAISIALHAGCTVYTTVGSPAKRAFLRERYPTLPDTHIGNSRDCSFEQLVLKRTCGRGVDMVLNSLAGDQLQASLRCLAEGGRFLEIGKVDLSAGSLLSMAVLLKNTTVHGILLDALFGARQYHHEKVAVMRCVSEGIVNGAVRPLPAVEYADYQLEQAFRYMATGKHIGKVLIRIREEESGGHSPPPRLLPALPRTYMHPAKSYVLVGGLGGFGLELCDWLVKQGARALVLNSRSGVRTGYQAWCIRRWREKGIQVNLSTSDVTTVAGARTLLGEAARAAPVGGIFNLAAVWHDAFLENQTPENFLAVTKPKIDGTRALDVASRELAQQLDYFVVFSSVACGRGTHGQSNYGLANSAMERLCEQRQADSLPALAVQWGAIGDVGIVATVTKGVSDIVLADTVPQGIASCLNTLDALMTLPHAVTAAMVVADKRPPKKPSQEIVQVVANILGIKDPSKISDSTSLSELGMDSLMSAEIEWTLERGYALLLSMAEVRRLTFGKLRSIGSATSVPVASAKSADQSICSTVTN